jgi:hypothetical protein
VPLQAAGKRIAVQLLVIDDQDGGSSCGHGVPWGSGANLNMGHPPCLRKKWQILCRPINRSTSAKSYSVGKMGTPFAAER